MAKHGRAGAWCDALHLDCRGTVTWAAATAIVPEMIALKVGKKVFILV